MKSKKGIIITILVILLLLVVGVTYAFFTYESGTKSDIVTGQIYMNYEETSTISLTGVFPETKEQALSRNDENGVFEFTITGRNTSKYPVYYEIDLLEGGVITGKTEQSTKILPEHVMIYLEKDGVPVIEGKTYADWNNRLIYVDTVPANQTSNIEHKYTLRMWIDENVTISDTDLDADYTTTEWNDAYTSLKVRVVGDFEYKEVPKEPTAVDIIINSLGTNGLVAVATDGSLYTDESTQTIRDYRFSGSNSVVTNNYVNFNNELWRIIGIMPTEKEDGTTENLMKIIKSKPLTAAQIPTTYTYNGVAMTLKGTDTYNTVYWNNSKYFGQTNNTDWTKAAVQYFLNEETEGSSSYYNSIDSTYQAMIQKSVYHLGNATYNTTTKVSYKAEQSETIWDENEETWTGNIGLMYPSDYGYAADSAYWDTSMYSYNSTAKNYDWLHASSNTRWTISPSADVSSYAMLVNFNGSVSYGAVVNTGCVLYPVLYLKSDVMISGGEGTSLVPYELSF